MFVLLMVLVLSLSGTELHEVLRLPVLWRHFNEHKALNPEMSFYSFLELHYANSQSSTHPENETDHNLPFKSHECGSLIKYSIKKKDLSSIIHFVDGIVSHTDSFVFKTLPSGYKGLVWQPPQLF